jgi:hydroxymethylpyrimidine pyrophosphatase-like HAD family hydrolase
MKKNPYRIIGVDFDGTLAISKGTYPEITGQITEVLDYVLEEQKNGAYVILITMREGKELDDAVEWCRQRGLIFDAVNDNIKHMKDYFNNNPRKIFCTEYIDDMNLGGINYILQTIRNKKGDRL